MAAGTRRLTEKDAAEWARFAGRVARLPDGGGGGSHEPPATEPKPPLVRRAAGSAPVLVAPPDPLGVGGQPPGVDTATWQRFRRGQVDSTRKLDLHGMTAQRAFAALRAFLRSAQADRVRCVEIVTGRGNAESGGVLRRELPLWLNLPEIRPMVLAAAHPYISTAMHSHSANPASVRLLLRRPRA